jgi:Fanconi anemia group M protein
LNIIADYREQASGIIDLVKERNIVVKINKIPHGDYIVNNWITVERKTAKDFLVSIISRRLFYQLTNLKEHCDCPILLIEGDPYKTDFNFKHNAIKGALLSIQTIWYIPIIFSCSKDDTRNILIMIGKQDDSNTESLSLRGGYRPRKLMSKQLYVLQGFPRVGPVIAKRLIEHFKSISQIINAPTEELIRVEGLGMTSAKEIREVLDTTVTKL